MTTRPLFTLHDVWAEFCPRLEVPMVIAGGACRDALANRPARDWDIFTFAPVDPLAYFGLEVLPRIGQSYEALSCTDLLWRGQKVQVVHKQGVNNVDELWATFDWAICCHAFRDGKIISHSDAQRIESGGVLRLNNDSQPQNALRRGFMFAERFNMTISPDALATLCGSYLRIHDGRERAKRKPAWPRLLAA